MCGSPLHFQTPLPRSACEFSSFPPTCPSACAILTGRALSRLPRCPSLASMGYYPTECLMLSSLDTAPRTRDERESTRDAATPRRPQCDPRSNAEMEPALRVPLHLESTTLCAPSHHGASALSVYIPRLAERSATGACRERKDGSVLVCGAVLAGARQRTQAHWRR